VKASAVVVQCVRRGRGEGGFGGVGRWQHRALGLCYIREVASSLLLSKYSDMAHEQAGRGVSTQGATTKVGGR
jgi:hypothetical protein